MDRKETKPTPEPPHPDQGLPGRSGNRPDPGRPGDRPRPDNTLPGEETEPPTEPTEPTDPPQPK